jgi:hypothetical protein
MIMSLCGKCPTRYAYKFTSPFAFGEYYLGGGFLRKGQFVVSGSTSADCDPSDTTHEHFPSEANPGATTSNGNLKLKKKKIRPGNKRYEAK